MDDRHVVSADVLYTEVVRVCVSVLNKDSQDVPEAFPLPRLRDLAWDAGEMREEVVHIALLLVLEDQFYTLLDNKFTPYCD